MGGLRRSEDPEKKSAPGKIGAALHSVNDSMKYNEVNVKDNLTEINRSSTYVETNVKEFTPQQQDAIKKAIMGADTGKTTLPNGNKVGGIEDVKFVTGKNGATVIELQAGITQEITIDYKKLEASLEDAKDTFKDIHINVGDSKAQEAAKAAAAAIKHLAPEKAKPEDHSQAPATNAGATLDALMGMGGR
jgi:hypothetical protein